MNRAHLLAKCQKEEFAINQLNSHLCVKSFNIVVLVHELLQLQKAGEHHGINTLIFIV